MRRFFVLATLGLTLALASPPAHACVNVTKADLDTTVKNVKAAEAALESGDLAKVRFWLDPALRVLGDVQHAIDPRDGKVHAPDGSKTDPPDPSLRRRAMRVDALSISRNPKGTAEGRELALKKFETEVLGQTQPKTDTDARAAKPAPAASPDPTVLADYGELLSRVPARDWQGLMTLRTLRDKDLIGSAYAYAALAELEKKQGDAKAEAQAREKCRLSAKRPSMCDAK